ncbi:MAG: FtsX-like permease family protein [Acidobacteria bacterium]|nr:FtsX-like permease family protein [Acidobacteriota bacterium]
MHRDFRPLLGAGRDSWIPLPQGQDGAFLRMVGTLRDGWDVDASTAELKIAAQGLVTDDLVRYSVDGARVVTLADAVSGSAGRLLSLLWTAAAGVLLLSCVNVVNLLYARWGRRRSEFEVRQAVGASRTGVHRQLLLESTLLSLTGFAIALPGVIYIAPWLGAQLDVPGDAPELRAATLAFALILALAVGLVCGVLPARRVLRRARGGSSRSRDLLIGSQVATALVVLIGAGLAVRSAERVAAIDPGFDSSAVVLMQLSPLESRYDEPESRVAYYDDVLSRIDALPGVVAAGASQIRPMTLENWSLPYHVDGMEPPADGGATFVGFRIVSTGYHDAVGESLVAGRSFDSTDGRGVAVINAALARKHWDDTGAAVGSTIRLYEADGPELQVLGVVSDVRQHQLEAEPEPALYIPFAASPQVGMHLAVRLSRDPIIALAEIKQAVWQVDTAVPILGAQTFDQAVDDSLGERRALSSMLGVLAALSLVLAAAGVYSVMSLVVLRQRREIAIRLAVGAAPDRVVRTMTVRIARVVAVGLGVGLGLALAAWSTFESLLYETTAADPLTIGVALVLICAVAVGASLAPLLRAARINPAALLVAD